MGITELSSSYTCKTLGDLERRQRGTDLQNPPQHQRAGQRKFPAAGLTNGRISVYIFPLF